MCIQHLFIPSSGIKFEETGANETKSWPHIEVILCWKQQVWNKQTDDIILGGWVLRRKKMQSDVVGSVNRGRRWALF